MGMEMKAQVQVLMEILPLWECPALAFLELFALPAEVLQVPPGFSAADSEALELVLFLH